MVLTADLQQEFSLNPSSLSPPLSSKQTPRGTPQADSSPLSTGDHLGAACWLVDCWWLPWRSAERPGARARAPECGNPGDLTASGGPCRGRDQSQIHAREAERGPDEVARSPGRLAGQPSLMHAILAPGGHLLEGSRKAAPLGRDQRGEQRCPAACCAQHHCTEWHRRAGNRRPHTRLLHPPRPCTHQ